MPIIQRAIAFIIEKVLKLYSKRCQRDIPKVPKLAIQHHHICWEFYMDQPHGERNQALILLDVANKSKNESNTDVCKDSEEEIWQNECHSTYLGNKKQKVMFPIVPWAGLIWQVWWSCLLIFDNFLTNLPRPKVGMWLGNPGWKWYKMLPFLMNTTM